MKLTTVLLMALALGAETRAYWWHQRFAPPISQTIVAGEAKEFIAIVATDSDERTGGFLFTIRYRAKGVFQVESRLVTSKHSRAGQTASAVFEVAGASEVSATVAPATLGQAAEAVGR